MDPKQQTTSLDPKLKEAYERVMGIGGTTATQTTPVPTTTPPQKADGPTLPKVDSNPVSPMSSAIGTTPSPAAPVSASPTIPPAISTVLPTSASPISTASNVGTTFPSTTPPIVQPTKIDIPMNQSRPQQSPVIPSPPLRTVGGAIPAQPQATNPVSLATGAKSHAFVATKKGTKISPVILVIAGVVFLLVYTLFWIKFFGVKVPFLP